MKPATIEYKQKVWQFLDKMKPGERYVVNKICEPENQEAFIECVKKWMDKLPYQGGLSFNHNYSEFYKSHLPVYVRKSELKTI